jgi:hypothetical protein
LADRKMIPMLQFGGQSTSEELKSCKVAFTYARLDHQCP